MPEGDGVLTATIEDYLLGLADGVVTAQRELDANAGRTNRYHLPRLAFELKVMMEIEERAAGAPTAPPPAGTRPPIGTVVGTGPTPRRMVALRMRPVASQEAADPKLLSAVSTIRGELLAAPIDQRPITLASEIARLDARLYQVSVLATEKGQPLSGVDVHFNIDRERSRAVNEAMGSARTLDPITAFERGVVQTGTDGRATSVLTIAASEPTGTMVTMVIDAAGRSEQLYVRAEDV